MSQWSFHPCWFIVLGAMVLFTGCDSGQRRMRIWGDVTHENQPVADGTIVFTPIDGTKGPSTGGSIKEGHYEVPAISGPFPGGVYSVEITALRRTGKKIPTFMVKDAPDFELSENYIPARYNRETTLKATISDDAEKNRFDFSL